MIPLLNARTYQFQEFHDNIPPYVIFSHTWDKDEIRFQDLIEITKDEYFQGMWRKTLAQPRLRMEERRRCSKLFGFLALVARNYSEQGWVWVDSSCIDKSSSAELSESIVSMFRWYQEATVCIAHLSDVTNKEDFRKARWFTRGWTLQELLAPKDVIFYNQNYSQKWTRNEVQCEIESITGIPRALLEGSIDLDNVRAEDVWTWSRDRKTTRPEDLAYCLLGLFGVSMAVIYGEGEKNSFRRLRREILRAGKDRQEDTELRAAILAKEQEKPQIKNAQPELFWDKSVVLKEDYKENNPALGVYNEKLPKDYGEELRRLQDGLLHSNQSTVDAQVRAIEEHQDTIQKSIQDEFERVLGLFGKPR
jgi:hypothetical protein